MTEKEFYCSASVTFTIRVKGSGHWGKEATVEEVMRMGGRETIAKVEKALLEGKLNYQMVEPPKVGAVTWEPKGNLE